MIKVTINKPALGIRCVGNMVHTVQKGVDTATMNDSFKKDIRSDSDTTNDEPKQGAASR